MSEEFVGQEPGATNSAPAGGRISGGRSIASATRRRAALAMAATHGSSERDLVLRSDTDGMAMLGVHEEGPLMADVLRWQGTVLRERGKTAEAESLYKRSLELAQKLDYLAGQSHAVNCLGIVAQRRGDLRRANQLFQSAQRMAEGCGDVHLAGLIQQNRGVVADMAGNTEAALDHYAESLRAFEVTNDTRGMTLVLNNLGLLQFKAERYPEARSSYDRALDLARTRGDLLCEGVIEENVAELELARGDLNAAGESIARALEIASLREDPLRRAAGLKLLGISLHRDGRAQDAVEALTHALTVSAHAQDALLCGEINFECGMAHAQLGNASAARQSWAMALDTFERMGATTWADRVRNVMGT